MEDRLLKMKTNLCKLGCVLVLVFGLIGDLSARPLDIDGLKKARASLVEATELDKKGQTIAGARVLQEYVRSVDVAFPPNAVIEIPDDCPLMISQQIISQDTIFLNATLSCLPGLGPNGFEPALQISFFFAPPGSRMAQVSGMRLTKVDILELVQANIHEVQTPSTDGRSYSVCNCSRIAGTIQTYVPSRSLMMASGKAVNRDAVLVNAHVVP